jgi:hypothetical protein
VPWQRAKNSRVSRTVSWPRWRSLWLTKAEGSLRDELVHLVAVVGDRPGDVDSELPSHREQQARLAGPRRAEQERHPPRPDDPSHVVQNAAPLLLRQTRQTRFKTKFGSVGNALLPTCTSTSTFNRSNRTSTLGSSIPTLSIRSRQRSSSSSISSSSPGHLQIDHSQITRPAVDPGHSLDDIVTPACVATQRRRR